MKKKIILVSTEQIVNYDSQPKFVSLTLCQKLWNLTVPIAIS